MVVSFCGLKCACSVLHQFENCYFRCVLTNLSIVFELGKGGNGLSCGQGGKHLLLITFERLYALCNVLLCTADFRTALYKLFYLYADFHVIIFNKRFIFCLNLCCVLSAGLAFYLSIACCGVQKLASREVKSPFRMLVLKN